MTEVNDFIQAVRGEQDADQATNNARLYALVDHAGAPGLLAELGRRTGIPWCSLFEDSKEQGALEVAPVLIQFADGGSSQTELKLLAWLHRACKFSTSLTVLQSSLAQPALASALKRRLNAKLPDGMFVMLRYFDTRILGSLITVLTAAQRGEFLGVAARCSG